VSPDGAHLYAVSKGDKALAVFTRNSTAGTLTYVEVHKDGIAGVDGLNSARHVVVSGDGAHVYVAGELDNAVAIFTRNPTTGRLTYQGVVRDGVGSVDGLAGVYGVAVSPDGTRVYAAGRGENALAVFQRNQGTGALTFVEVERDGVSGVNGLDGARSVAVSPDAAHVYTAGEVDDAVAAFAASP
jgi:6-phosphogluconolactonase (cycloisomerase 2 family)